MTGRWTEEERIWNLRASQRADPYGRDPRTERDYGDDAYRDDPVRDEDYRGRDPGARSFSAVTGGQRPGDRPLEPGYGPVFGEYETGADYSPRDRGRAIPSAARYPRSGYRVRPDGEPRGERAYREVYGYGPRDDLSGRDWEGRGGRERGRYMDRPPEERNFLDRAAERLSAWFGEAGGEMGGRREPGLHRGRGPQAYRRPDERIADEVHGRLTEDAWVDASNIAVSVSGGEVTLSGTVPEREAKHRAERLIEDLGGVTHVQNNLRVARGGFLNSPDRGYGDSAQAAQMAQVDPAPRPRTDS